MAKKPKLEKPGIVKDIAKISNAELQTVNNETDNETDTVTEKNNDDNKFNYIIGIIFVVFIAAALFAYWYFKIRKITQVLPAAPTPALPVPAKRMPTPTPAAPTPTAAPTPAEPTTAAPAPAEPAPTPAPVAPTEPAPTGPAPTGPAPTPTAATSSLRPTPRPPRLMSPIPPVSTGTAGVELCTQRTGEPMMCASVAPGTSFPLTNTEVQVYSECNFGGEFKFLGVGTYKFPYPNGILVKSIKLPNTLDIELRAEKRMYTFTAKDAGNLIDCGAYYINGYILQITVFPASSTRTTYNKEFYYLNPDLTNEIQIYDACDYQGVSYSLGPGVYDFPNPISMKSIVIPDALDMVVSFSDGTPKNVINSFLNNDLSNGGQNYFRCIWLININQITVRQYDANAEGAPGAIMWNNGQCSIS